MSRNKVCSFFSKGNCKFGKNCKNSHPDNLNPQTYSQNIPDSSIFSKDNNMEKKCEIYEENATNLCLKCMSYFCDSCFKFIHEKKNKKDHQKELVDPFAPIDTKCRDHPLIPITLFCINEKGKSYIYIYFNFRIMLCIMLF